MMTTDPEQIAVLQDIAEAIRAGHAITLPQAVSTGAGVIVFIGAVMWSLLNWVNTRMDVMLGRVEKLAADMKSDMRVTLEHYRNEMLETLKVERSACEDCKDSIIDRTTAKVLKYGRRQDDGREP